MYEFLQNITDTTLNYIHNISLESIGNTLLVTIIVPACLVVIKREADSFFTDLSTYRNRRFDMDGDPGIGCECYLLNQYTGKFKKILVKDYTFHLFESKREVITVQDAPDVIEEGDVIIVPYTYAQWRNLIKGSLIKKIEDVVKEIQDAENQ
jgi:hypothetical protein